MLGYASLYPEANLLHKETSRTTAGDLVLLFSHVRLPKEVYSIHEEIDVIDVYQLLHVKHIQMSVYHPQTNELVEHFNKTLKLR